MDSLLEGMRQLLVESLQQEEILVAVQELRVKDYDELNDQKWKDLKLLEIQQRIQRGKGLLNQFG